MKYYHSLRLNTGQTKKENKVSSKEEVLNLLLLPILLNNNRNMASKRPLAQGAKQLWLYAGIGCVLAFTGKQLLWHHVSTAVTQVRDSEHKKAVEVYDAAIRNAQNFKLPPLSDAQRTVIRQRLKDGGMRSAADIEKGGEVVGVIDVPITAQPKECCADKKI